MSVNDPTGTEKRDIVSDLSGFPHVYHDVDFQSDEYDEAPGPQNDGAQAGRSEVDVDRANVISSRLQGEDLLDEDALHSVALDLDHHVRVVPSTTAGHHHLYIDVKMPWREYALLLSVLAHVGIIEPGYAAASLRRRATHLRLPWVKKEPTAPPEPLFPLPAHPSARPQTTDDPWALS